MDLRVVGILGNDWLKRSMIRDLDGRIRGLGWSTLDRDGLDRLSEGGFGRMNWLMRAKYNLMRC